MKKNWFLLIGLMILSGALMRIFPNKPLGFAPQVAMAIFAGSIFKDKKLAFLVPLFSMLVSDLIFEVLYINGKVITPGFYEGQWTNYLIIGMMTIIGFFVNQKVILSILAGALIAPFVYFLLSNFSVWIAGGGYARPKTLSGFMQCMADGLPFLRGSIYSSIVFSAIFFGVNYLLSAKLKNIKA